MSDFIGIDITGHKEIAAKLAKLPSAVADDGVEASNAYLLNALRAYPPYKYVSRKRAYGTTFVSAKQRRYVMARIHEGTITPGISRRTQTFSRGWAILGEGRKGIIVNEVPYGKHLVDDEYQARQPGLVGWQKIAEQLKDRTVAIVKAFDGGVKKAIKRLRL